MVRHKDVPQSEALVCCSEGSLPTRQLIARGIGLTVLLL